MSGPSHPGGAESVFGKHLASLPSGAEADIDSLCRAYPEIAVDLRALNQNYQALLPVLRLAGPGSQPQRHIADEIRSRYGDEADPHVSLEGAPTEENSPSSELLKRLEAHAPSNFRYRLIGEVGRGGMGAVLRVWDEDLRRTLAMKVVLGKEDAATTGDTPPVDSRTLGRFLEEAQVTGQLDHPGIVPVHELGLDSGGRVYFTMKLVKGEDLRRIYEHVLIGKDGWNQTRALGVLLKACEALSYAHDKGVIHRDLKPANVMVGKYGEVYVMDWGLARVRGKKDRHDLRIQPEPRTSASVRTERREEREETPDSPIVTMDGDVVGTPAYMPPEQARGETAALGPQSDVYAVGAMLYHLLAGQMPFVPRHAKASARTVLMRVLEGPPLPVHTLAPDAPVELIAICEKAMAREPALRYPDTRALAEDLRAFLEHRVVSAHEAGTWAETRKWVQRNRALAASLLTALLILAGGILVSLRYAAQAAAEAKRADGEAGSASVARQEAIDERDRVLGLADLKRLDDLVHEADTLWPADPARVAPMDAWLVRAHALVARLPQHVEYRSKVRAQVESARRASERLAALASRVPAVEVSPIRLNTKSGLELEWLEQELTTLIEGIEAIASTGPVRGALTEMQERLQFASTIEELSITGLEAHRRWSEAIAAIATSPKYAGLKLIPQLGLLPIGPDPASGLWEFAHLRSGEPMTRGADGNLILTAEMGLVLVLIPGGTFWMGAQKTDPTGHNYDPQSISEESPVHEVTLDAYFMSKYEMTQGQWLRFVGRNPSKYGPGPKFGDKACSLLNPVEQVNWLECTRVLGRLGLVVPTEAEWEYGARAGTTSVWWTGDEKEKLQGAANLADGYCMTHGGPSGWQYEDGLDDGWATHACVGSYRSNAFGLHDVIGNVWEWCRDAYGSYDLPVREGDGERQVTGASSRAYRGGSFTLVASLARSAYRSGSAPEIRDGNLGVRPAMGITR